MNIFLGLAIGFVIGLILGQVIVYKKYATVIKPLIKK